MATKTGTTSQHKSKYTWYLDYTTSFSTSTMRWTVSVKVYLRVANWAYEGNTTHKLSIGGASVASRSNYNKACRSNSGTTDFLFASGSKTYAASSSVRSVALSGTANAPSNGWGPGKCSASTTISLAAKLSSAGAISTASVGTSGFIIRATGLPTNLGYTRTVKFAYKLTTATAWTSAGNSSVSASSSSASKAVTGLLPGKTYNVRYQVTAPDGTLMKTATATVTTLTDSAFNISLKRTTESSVEVFINGLSSNVSYIRYINGFYRKQGSTTWESSVVVSWIPAGGSAVGLTYLFMDLEPNTNYEFAISVSGNNTELNRATLVASTLKPGGSSESEDYTFDDAVDGSGGSIVVNPKNPSDTEVDVSLYARDASALRYYRIGGYSLDFTSTATAKTISWTWTNDSWIQQMLQNKNVVLKLNFLKTTVAGPTGIVDIAHLDESWV